MNKEILFTIIISIFVNIKTKAQSKAEVEVLNLSKTIFKWEVEDKIDSIKNIFDDKFVVVSSDGSYQNKKEYINRLRSKSFIHNNIEVIENAATVVNNTATVIGKGKFTVTIAGNPKVLLLAYIEVFTRVSSKKEWKVLAMKANIVEK